MFSKVQQTFDRMLNMIIINQQYNIQHGGNTGEYTIPELNRKVDGFCKETNTVYEFHGDYWHGNLNRFNPTDLNKRLNKTMKQLNELTTIKDQQIIDCGYNLMVMWEQDWKNSKQVKS